MDRDIVEDLESFADNPRELDHSRELARRALFEILRLRTPPAPDVTLGMPSSVPLRLDREAYILSRLAPGEAEKIAEAMLKIMDDRVEQALAEVM